MTAKRYVIQIQNVYGEWRVSLSDNGPMVAGTNHHEGHSTLRAAVRVIRESGRKYLRVYDRKMKRPVTHDGSTTRFRRE